MPKNDLVVDASLLAQRHEADRMRGQLIQGALKDLLDEVVGARAALPHLAALEAALGQRGTAAIDEVPVQWLSRITKQLSSLPLRDDDLELQGLLARLCGTLALHQRPPEPAPASEANSDWDGRRADIAPGSIEISELSHTAFMEEFVTIAAAGAGVAATAQNSAAAPPDDQAR